MRFFIIFFILLTLMPSAEALPARVKVRLFSTQTALPHIYLYGPAEVIEPRKQTLPKGLFVVDTKGDGIDLRTANNSKLFTHVPRLVLAGPGGRTDSAVSLASAPHAAPRLFRGTVSISSSRSPANSSSSAPSSPPSSASLSSLPQSPSKPIEDRGGLVVVNDVDTRSYITSCVGSEALPSFGAEALKAQTVLSTTLLEKNFRGRPLDDSTEEQSYLGATSERPEVKAAVNSVFGEELYFDGRPIDVFFCSTCGGRTATPDVFGGSVKAGRYPYLKEVDCPFCQASPFSKEHREKTSAAQFFRATGLRRPHIIATHLGRPTRVSFEKGGRSASMSGYQFWLLVGKNFGWGFVPSTFYSIDARRAGDQDMIEFESRGCGHGVGLCQWGAAGQALAGRGYKEILYFYFPGTSLKTLTNRHLAHLPPAADISM